MQFSTNYELPTTNCACSSKRIIGILLVRNEERFVEQAVHNVINFCDHLLLVDHQSSDQTVPILRHLREVYSEKVSLHQIQHPSESHELLQSFVGSDTWVFGVDGDELYDSERLASFRKRILAGEFDQEWMVLGNVLHIDELDEAACRAAGYFSPPSRSITKLYNFAAIAAWKGKTLERLHGGQPVFRAGFHEQKKRLLHHEYSWEQSPLRCLHLCFLQRSSVELSEQRRNIMEISARRGMGFFKRIARALFHVPEPASWKQQHYQRGERQTVDASLFFKKKL